MFHGSVTSAGFGRVATIRNGMSLTLVRTARHARAPPTLAKGSTYTAV
jgi:hypothetical protein